MTEEVRQLALLSIPQKKFAKVKINADGSAIFYGATAFSKGTWTDSIYRKPVTFETEELAKTIHMWEGKPIWHNHPQIFNHAPKDSIGTMKNPRMEDGRVAVDLHAHGKTQASRDAIDMWQAGELPDLSAELTTVDVIRDKKRYGTKITPYAVAWVIKGACTVCKVHGCTDKEHSTHYENADGGLGRGTAAQNDGGKDMDVKELEAELKASQAKVKELSDCRDDKVKSLEAAETASAERTKEFKATISEKVEATDKLGKELEEAKKALAEAEAKVKVYENMPILKSKGSGSGGDEKEELISNFSKETDGTMEMEA